MRKIIEKCLAPLVALVSVPVLAGGFDGSDPMLCVAMDVIECVDGGSCETVRAEDINAPEFIWLDVKNMKVTVRRSGGDEAREIRNKEVIGGKLIIQGVGVENSVGWTLAVNEETGRMVVTASGDEAGFVMFGACTLL